MTLESNAMPEAHPQLNPADIKSLYRLMMDISFSPEGRENKTLRWFEHAYAINSTLCDPPTNLNRLYKALIAESGVMRKHAKKAFEFVLALGLLKHPHETETYLETLWHYLSPKNKESRLRHFADALRKVDLRPSLFIETVNPQHLCILHAMAHILEQKESSSLSLRQLSKCIISQGANKETISAIEYLHSVVPESLQRLGALYTSELDYRGINIDISSPEKALLTEKIFINSIDLFKHACYGITVHMMSTLDIYSKKREGIGEPFSIDQIKLTFDLFKSASGHVNKNLPEKQIFDIFSRFNTRNDNADLILSAREEIIEVLRLCGQCMDDIGITWKKIGIGALSGLSISESKQIDNWLDLCGQAIIDSGRRPIKKTLAFMLIEELPISHIIHYFDKKPKVLSEVYKLNGNPELLAHIPSNLRKECLQSDLGL